MDKRSDDDTASDAARLRALEARLAEKRAQQGREASHAAGFLQANHAWRMVIELVSGLVIGFGIGYGIDELFGTKPILMLIFTVLGLIAGIRTMMRTAEEIKTKPDADPGTNEKDGNSGE